MRKWALRVAAAGLAVWGLWLVAANAWLNVGVAGKPFLTLRAAEVRVGRAFSWWPGRVRGSDLRIIVHDANVEMDLRIDRFDLVISMFALARKELHTTRARVEGISLRLRKTRPLPDLCNEQPGLPPVAGQAYPRNASLKDCLAQAETARPKGPTPPPEDLFHLRLEDLEVTNLREVWIEAWRFEGNIGLRGRWAFWPRLNLEIDLPSFNARDGRLTEAGGKLAEKLDLNLRGRLAPIHLGSVDSTAVWSAISTRAAVRLESFELKAIRRLLLRADPIAPPRLPGLDGLANVETELHLDAGHVKSFALSVKAEQAAIDLLERRLTGALRLRAHLHEDHRELSFTDTEMVILRPHLDGQAFDDVDVTVDAVGASRLDPQNQRADLDFAARISKLKLILALIPGGLPKTLAALLLGNGAQVTATGKLHATSDKARVDGFHADAGGLTLDGGFAFAPKLDGKLHAKYAIVSVDVPLGK